MGKKIRIGINGFGRIGRTVFRSLLEENHSGKLEVVAINDLGETEALAHLLEFDSIHGILRKDVSFNDGHIMVDGKSTPHYRVKDPSDIPWAKHDVDVVLEATGKFKKKSEAAAHIKAGARRVIITAVGSGEDIKTIVLGANDNLLDGTESVISNASCTTNCAAPLVDVIDKNFKIESGYITTVHSYTSDQTLHDRPHTDLRRARAAALSMIPTTTGAAKAITKIFPHLDGHLGGAGIRVPVPNGSLTDVTYIVSKKTSVEEVNRQFKKASEEAPWKGFLGYTEKPIVSSDVMGNTYSCVFDARLTSVIGNMVKVVGWYDNEMGYSSRLIDLAMHWSKFWDSSDKP